MCKPTADQGSPAPLELLDDGFVDPAAPESLHPALRGEAGLKLALWLRDGGATPSLISEAAETFRRYAGRHTVEPGREEFRDLLRTAIHHHGLDRSPAFALFLREALGRVDGPAQWEGLLLFLRRTATLLTLDSASGPIPQPPLPAGGPEVVSVYPRPRLWHCIYCGWRCDQEFNDYACGGCGAVRPFAGGSATMIQCGLCGGMSLALARFCEWCGAMFAESAGAEHGMPAVEATGSPASSWAAEGVLYCIFCGSACDTEGGDRTCQRCRREVPDPMSSTMGKMCPACQAFNLMAASYCERCGERFEGIGMTG
jgi:hypothetical protein